MRRLVAGAMAPLAIAVVALTPIGAAQALPPDGCPGGFYRLAAAPGLEFADENGDGWVCGKDLPRSPFGGIILDNIIRT